MKKIKKKTASPYSVTFNPVALRKAKIVYIVGLSECNRVKLLMAQTFYELRCDFELVKSDC